MKSLFALLLCLLCSTDAVPQSKPFLKKSGDFGFNAVGEYIRWDKYLEDKNQLLLIGPGTRQLLDLTTRKVIETRPISLPSLRVPESSMLEWEISPDGRWMLMIGHPDAKIGTKQPAWIWDLESGRRIAVLDQIPEKVFRGHWSRNGKTLMTFGDYPHSSPHSSRKLAVTFWDGETFAYHNTISLENMTWCHLSDDGQRFFAASGKQGNVLGVKYTSDKNGVITAWRTETGEIEKAISVADASFSPKTREISVSPDDRFMLFVNKHKTNAAENRLFAWEMNGSVRPLYELQPQPKIDDSRIEFSPDGKFFALDVGKNLQIYETVTGQKKAELQNVEIPDRWLSDDVIVRETSRKKGLFASRRVLTAFATTNGQVLYELGLVYVEVDTTDILGEKTGTEVVDSEAVIPNPKLNLFATKSYGYVKLFDLRTGALLQTVFSIDDFFDVDKGKHGVTKAEWSKDGKTLCIFSSDLRTVSLWELVEN